MIDDPPTSAGAAHGGLGLRPPTLSNFASTVDLEVRFSRFAACDQKRDGGLKPTSTEQPHPHIILRFCMLHSHAHRS